MPLLRRIAASLGDLAAEARANRTSFFFHRSVLIVVVVSVLLLSLVLVLGWSSYRAVKDVVTADFNQQQLLLARYAARQIGNLAAMLQKELSLLALSPSLQYYEQVAIGRRMGITFSSVREEGATRIRYVEAASGVAHEYGPGGYSRGRARFEDRQHLSWARDREHAGRVLFTPVYREEGAHPGGARLYMQMVTPVWQVSVDESNPRATNLLAGVLFFVVDVTRLVGKPARDVRSGKTGYAWIIDNTGTFLYHPEPGFVGESAFEARRRKEPTISFDRINEIQMTYMLTGKEGMSWYLTGWHGGAVGRVRKLIAYSPIPLSGEEGPVWSVAVVAPMSEVEGAIHAIQVRGFVLQGVIAAAFLAGTVIIVALMARWSTTLEREVARHTTELRRSEQRYRSLVESAGDIIFTADRAGNLLSVNSYGEKIFKCPAHQCVGRNLGQFLQCPTAEEVLLAIDEVFEQRKGRQITHLARIGERDYWLSTSLRRLIDETGNIYAVLGISRDITDRRVMEEQSYHTEKLASLGTLSAGVAHEINNPLTVILGFTDLLLEKAPPGSEQEDILRTVQVYGQKAKKVVDNLLTFARRKEHSEGEVDVNQCLEAVLAVLGNNLLVRKISVGRFDLDPGLPPVKGDADELQQVFFNIINNAIYAMKGGGTLEVSTRATESRSCAEVRIADTGPGIPREHRTRIFDPLFTTKKVGEGTGLGLSVSYGIVSRHRGTITFETLTRDEAAETGTTFVITLPASGGGGPGGAVAAPAPPAGPAEGGAGAGRG